MQNDICCSYQRPPSQQQQVIGYITSKSRLACQGIECWLVSTINPWIMYLIWESRSPISSSAKWALRSSGSVTSAARLKYA